MRPPSSSVGALPRGTVPQRPFADEAGAPWTINQRSRVYPGGVDFVGPVPATADTAPRISRGRTPERHVVLRVEDTGCGMPPDQLEKIFEPFFSTKERRGGTGLGMPIVEDIARAHGAAIEIESAEGRGTTVRLRWPTSGGAVTTADDLDAAQVGTAPTPTRNP